VGPALAIGGDALGTLGYRVRSAALEFVSWGPSAGALLLLATILAVALSNSALEPQFSALWEQHLGFTIGGAGFELPLHQ
jgi:NhaA family Na+:H+ antiporter